MAYRVLARAWRPQRFADLLGQEAVVRTLSNALDAGTFVQAYLFSGIRGVGKTSAARLLAKAVNCAEGPTAEPCGECDSCREITVGSSIDVIEMDAATNTGVDDVRELQELLRYHPTRDRYRVIIVDEVHMLSRAAFNALLKTIEEPPPYILWIFATTERTKVPDTILSRCQQLEFRPVGVDLIRRRLQAIAEAEAFSLSPSAAAAIAAAADGSVRDALSLLDQLRAFAAGEVDDRAVSAVLGVPELHVTAGLVEALAGGRVADGLALLREQLAVGQDPSLLYREIGHTLRSLLYLALDAGLEPALSETHRAVLRPIAADRSAEAFSRMLGLWVEQESLLRDAANRDLALEVAAARLARWPVVQQVEAWLAGSQQVPKLGPEAPPSDTSSGGVGALPSAEETTASGSKSARPSEADGPAGSESPGGAEEAVEAGAVLAEAVRSDPAVELATRVLGGEVVAVRPDGEGS
jgi:DNA polymerase-3 subunit gamma/tau